MVFQHMHKEPFLLSTLKVYRFRPLLIADLFPSVKETTSVSVCARMHACVWPFITSSYVQCRQPSLNLTVVK